jgi:hypothetical protein
MIDIMKKTRVELDSSQFTIGASGGFEIADKDQPG